MKIYLSTRVLRPPASGGASAYTLGLINAIACDGDHSLTVGLTEANTHFFENSLSAGLEKKMLSGISDPELAESEHILITELQPDWVVYPYPANRDCFDLAQGVRIAVIIYDLQHADLPEFFDSRDRWKRDLAVKRAVDHADLLATISEFSAERITHFYPNAAEKLVTIYAGAKESSKRATEFPDRSYLLYPANLWPHKNHEMLLQAFSLLKSNHPDLSLVLTGDDSMAGKQLQNKLRALGVDSRGYVSDGELDWLRRGASCLVFPSLYEGFGMPVIEALQVGTPVACSDFSSLPEVGGEAAEYFDPLNPQSIADAVERAMQNRDQGEWQKRALRQAAKFTFKRTAELLLQSMERRNHVPKQISKETPEIKEEYYSFDDLDAFWTAFPSVDALLIPREAKMPLRFRPSDLNALDRLEVARINPTIFGALRLRDNSSNNKSLASRDIVCFDYRNLLSLVAEGKLVLTLQTEVAGSRSIKRLDALCVLMLQLKYLRRTCREALIAVITGSWGT